MMRLILRPAGEWTGGVERWTRSVWECKDGEERFLVRRERGEVAETRLSALRLASAVHGLWRRGFVTKRCSDWTGGAA